MRSISYWFSFFNYICSHFEFLNDRKLSNDPASIYRLVSNKFLVFEEDFYIFLHDCINKLCVMTDWQSSSISDRHDKKTFLKDCPLINPVQFGLALFSSFWDNNLFKHYIPIELKVCHLMELNFDLQWRTRLWVK